MSTTRSTSLKKSKPKKSKAKRQGSYGSDERGSSAPTPTEPLNATSSDASASNRYITTDDVSASNNQKVDFAVENATKTKEKNDSARWRAAVINELMKSEEQHVELLSTLVTHYLNPLQKENILNATAHRTIFCNFSLILNWNVSLLVGLEAHLENGGTIGDLFVEMIPVLRQLYSEYSENYDRAIRAYQDASKQFYAWLEKTQKDRKDTRDFISYLYLPIQRMIAYITLLTDILALTQPDHADYRYIAQAIEALKDASEHGTERAKQRKNLDRVLEIQNSLLEGDERQIAVPHRRHIFEGNVRITTNPKLEDKDRRLFLFNDLLLVARVRKKRKKLEIEITEPLHTLRVENIPDSSIENRDRFKLHASSNTYIISTADKIKWMQVLNLNIKLCKATMGTEDIKLHDPLNSIEQSSREYLIHRIVGWSKLSDPQRIYNEIKDLAVILEKYDVHGT